MAPLELYEKIYVKPSFLNTEHGQISCETCHNGDPNEPDWQTAHKGIVKDPTFPDPENSCGDCHDEIASTAKNSLHYTLAPLSEVIKARANKKDKEILHQVFKAKERHCSSCHSSCGQCHISRPNYVDGGFLAGHVFQRKPPVDTTCASCHGGRVYKEFTGGNDDYPADVHYEKKEMTCVHCHTSEEMHADATGVLTRFDFQNRPRCEKCHPDAASEKSKIASHAIHKENVACQVCHAVANKNCFNCHVGQDKKGLPYYKCKTTKMLFKIGLSPRRSKERPHQYVVMRHPPANPKLFQYYVGNGLADFNKLPTWKLDSPHSIQRITPQNKDCNNCHGNAALFLRRQDLTDWEQKANATVIVPDDKIPQPIKGGNTAK